MMANDSASGALARLRAAVARGSFSEAQAVLNELRQAFQAAPAGPQAESLAREALKTLAWARKTTLAARAHDATRLARLQRRPRAYLARPAPARAGINLTA